MSLFPSPSRLILGLICLACILPEKFYGTKALNCINCDPCDAANAGSPTPCDMDPYKDLPENGKMACSYEHLASDRIRRRCRFIRNDPDTVAVSETTRCYDSPFDDSKKDCICFKDGCNKEQPVSNETDYDIITTITDSNEGLRLKSSIYVMTILSVVGLLRKLMN